MDDLLFRLKEIDELLETGVGGHFERVERLAVAIARSAPSGDIGDLAMQALSAAHERNRNGDSAMAASDLKRALSRLRAALEEAKKAAR